MIETDKSADFSASSESRSEEIIGSNYKDSDKIILEFLQKYRGLLVGFVTFVILLKLGCRLRRFVNDRDVESVPYTCLYIDARLSDFKCVFSAYRKLFRLKTEQIRDIREKLYNEIQETWSKANSQPVITCLSINSALDLFLRVQKYPPNSEIIITAINNPDIAKIIIHHGLKVVALDIDRDTLSAHMGTLAGLITENTVALFFTHLFGNMADLDDAIELVHSHGIHVLEDSSQCYNGPTSEGNKESDLTFYDFDVIRTCTTFGGAVIKVKDNMLYNSITKLHDTYPVHQELEYVKLSLKTYFLGSILKNKLAIRLAVYFGGVFSINVKQNVKAFLTTERNKGLIRKLREQPPTAMLYLLSERFSSFDKQDIQDIKSVCEYVCDRLPPTACQIGTKTKKRGFWLFPILVDDPEKVISHLNKLGVNATRSVVNLQVIASDQHDFGLEVLEASDNPLIFGLNYTPEYPPDEAKDILQHVIYLPVHKYVTQYYLDEICLAVEIVLNKLAILKKYKSGLTIHGPYGPILQRSSSNGSKRKSVTFSPTVMVRSPVAKDHQTSE